MEKDILFKLFDVECLIGIQFIESCVMLLGLFVFGFYFGYVDSYYFGVGKIEKDQVEDYVVCKGWDIGYVECWFVLILNYDFVWLVVVE